MRLPGDADEGAFLRRFWDFSKRYLVRYWWWYVVGFMLVFATQWLAVSIVDQVRQAIDAVGVEGATRQTVMPFILTIFGFALVLVLIRTASRLLVFTPGRMIEYNVRNDYYSNLLNLQREFLAHHQSGDLVSRCSNDIAFVRAAYGFAFLQVVNVTATLGMAIWAMFRMDARVTIFVVIPMILSLVVIQVSIRYLFRFWRLSNEQLGDLSSLTLASFRGVAAIQNYHAEPAVIARFSGYNQSYLETQKVIVRNRSFVIPIVKLVENLSVLLVLLFVGAKVVAGEMTLGQITAFLGYIAMVMPPMLSLGWMMSVFSRAIPAMERLDEILLAEPNLPPVVALPQDAASPHGSLLQTNKLSFSFPVTPRHNHPFRLRGISLELPQGRVLGIVGPLGSGKTVLLDTLMRLNKPEEGQLFVNGFDAATMALDVFRARFSFAPQRALLFSSTLRENLLIALPVDQWATTPDQRLSDVLGFAGFQLDPDQFPKGLATEVGEKGVMLSGGQRQRIALARALLKDADVYVLDDVLSAVDHETEKNIISNIRDFAPGKSFIIASHRVSAIQWADEILVVEDGAVIDKGTHEELAARPGFYRDIYRYQSQRHGDEP